MTVKQFMRKHFFIVYYITLKLDKIYIDRVDQGSAAFLLTQAIFCISFLLRAAYKTKINAIKSIIFIYNTGIYIFKDIT